MRVKLFLAVLILISCNQKEKKDFSINQPMKSIALLKSSVINNGDTSAYYELFNYYVDKSSENDFFYYSYVMAFKYDYPKAYVDVFFSLCKIYNVDTDADKINIGKMDLHSKEFALECMKRASQLNYLNSKKIYQSILSENKE